MRLLAFLSCVLAFSAMAADVELASPDGNVTAGLLVKDGVLCYSVAFKGKPVIHESRMGVFAPLAGAYVLTGQKREPLSNVWRNPFGERSVVTDKCDRVTLSLEQGARKLTLEARAYDAGFAFRFAFPEQAEKHFAIAQESTEFAFGGDFRCWPVNRAQGEYKPAMLSQITPGVERPFVVELRDCVAAIGEAANLDFARMKFAPGKAGTVVSVLDGAGEFNVPYRMPWRYVRVADDVCRLYMGNDLLLNLNEPSRIADTSWIKPGKVIRVSHLSTASGKDCVEFAKKMGLSYIELDAGWYGKENIGDPLKPGLDPKNARPDDPFDLHEIIAYAKANGIGVLLYVNREPLKKNIDAILPQLKAWGADGVKYGFVDVGAQKWTAWVSDAIEKAAGLGLMLDIHDEYRMTGNARTWPNLLTVEGIRGNEEMPAAAHNCALVFTRYLCGGGDYTPCWRQARVKNSLAHQLAMPAVYFSPFQFLYWYSTPKQIDADDPALDFWKRIPTVWDETLALQGKIGEFAVMARRSGNDWYVGGLNAVERRGFRVPLSFLGDGKYTAFLYRDANPAATDLNAVKCETKAVGRADVLALDAASNGGFAIRLTPAQ